MSQPALGTRQDSGSNEDLSNINLMLLAPTACCACTGNMACAANQVMLGDGPHLSTELFVGGSKVVLQLLLQVLQNLAVQLLQSGQGGRDPLWPSAAALYAPHTVSVL